MVSLMNYVAYAKTVAITVARVLIAVDGDADRALEMIGSVDTADFQDPIMAEIAKSLAEQAIREAVAL